MRGDSLQPFVCLVSSSLSLSLSVSILVFKSGSQTWPPPKRRKLLKGSFLRRYMFSHIRACQQRVPNPVHCDVRDRLRESAIPVHGKHAPLPPPTPHHHHYQVPGGDNQITQAYADNFHIAFTSKEALSPHIVSFPASLASFKSA
jgi:hypothetical protein